ncbi:MAG: prepilin-type N-terminal cleavage/methylation domain-containing protein [Rhodospirillaceae bacterium]
MKGFTLLEAIIAIAILGITMMPIMNLLGQSVAQLTFAGQANNRAVATESALAVLDSINPSLTPTGKIQITDTLITWDSEILVEPNEIPQMRAGLAGYSVGFYKVTVSVIKEEEPWFTFELRKVGYNRISGRGPFEETGR